MRLSEPLQFLPAEIWLAVHEDYPDLRWSVAVDPPFDSGRISMATYFGDQKGGAAQHGLIIFLSSAGRYTPSPNPRRTP